MKGRDHHDRNYMRAAASAGHQQDKETAPCPRTVQDGPIIHGTTAAGSIMACWPGLGPCPSSGRRSWCLQGSFAFPERRDPAVMDQSRASPHPDLGRRAIKGTLLFVVALWLLIFVPAGSLTYWQGWLFWANFSIWAAAGAWYFLKRDPALVQRRLRAGPAAEREPAQKRIQLFLSVVMCALFVVSALDQRLGWSAVSWLVVIAGNILVAIGYLLV